MHLLRESDVTEVLASLPVAHDLAASLKHLAHDLFRRVLGQPAHEYGAATGRALFGGRHRCICVKRGGSIDV